MDILSDPSVQAVMSLVSEASKASISEKLLVVAIVWWSMRGKVNSLKNEIKAGLEKIANEVSQLRATVAKDLAVQTSRLDGVEAGIMNLNSRVKALEQKE